MMKARGPLLEFVFNLLLETCMYQPRICNDLSYRIPVLIIAAFGRAL